MSCASDQSESFVYCEEEKDEEEEEEKVSPTNVTTSAAPAELVLTDNIEVESGKQSVTHSSCWMERSSCIAHNYVMMCF